jgi:hypothetical protein
MDRTEIEKDLKKYSSLDGLAISEGGKILIETLKTDVISTINELRFKSRELSHIELIGLCIKLNEKLNIISVLNNAEENKALTKEEYDKLAE